MRRGRQAVNVCVILHGLQDTTVAAHLPGTSAAALSVRVGGALVWMHDHATVSAFAQVWLAEGFSARRLPREPSGIRAADAPARQPTVMVEAADAPAASASLLRHEGRRTRMWVVLGRIAFDVRDHSAFRSTLTAFRRAAEIAPQVFVPAAGAAAPEKTALAKAAEVGSRAFLPPAGPRRCPESARTGASPRSAPAVRRHPELGRIDRLG